MSFAHAETIRVATYDVELSRKGPGLMLRDITRSDPQVVAITQVVTHLAPDILFLQGVDYDADLLGAKALRDHFGKRELDYPHVFSLPPNTGIPTGLDMNGDGRLHTPADAQGYGKFRGAGGMVVLSRWPFGEARDFSVLLWRDLPEATLPGVNGQPFPSEEAQAIQRLSSNGHWVLPALHPNGPVTLMLFAAGPPVFDGPEDQNGLRNADEIRLWSHLLDGKLGPAPEPPFVLMGGANLDPQKGEGRHEAIQGLLTDPRLQDPLEKAGPTVDWREPTPGDLRVDYVLPSADLKVIDAGVFWPKPKEPGHELLSEKDIAASRHHMVWVDIAF
ncbi:MAG: endonuclease/exonuclease/phosphatase family protein [Shimia sp.]|uniref:endonuclease/exonuclease/phosphatase family protein n=1 Tax=Shimia sp. TaxID=1954381 RepID=UPI0025F03ED3|nr:endonuclease/exonuclease/phosphatase family protein [Shimia sp.]MCH2067809.1 endonuclease/exonuclease/phosphatase family protein [Shimia sp.]